MGLGLTARTAHLKSKMYQGIKALKSDYEGGERLE
jgi:hypothetical protein